MTPLDAVPYMGALAGVGVLLDSAECLVSRRELSADGMYSWDVLSVGHRIVASGPLAKPLGAIFTYPNVLLLVWVQMAAAVALMATPAMRIPERYGVIAVAALGAAVARVLFIVRQQVGIDGSDQMMTIVLLSCGFGAALGNTAAGTAAVCYAGLQLLLSYWAAGVGKALSSEWRTGRAIVGITGTGDYGHAALHRLLGRHPQWARLLCWMVIVFECAAPFLVLAGRDGAVVLVACGVGFHASVAIFMRLNNFLWAFAAAYPAVFLLSDMLAGVLRN